MASLDLTKFNDSQVADLESGDPERINRVLGITAKPAEPVADKPAEEAAPVADAPNSEAADKVRISIKALKPEDRLKMVRAMDAIRNNGKTPAEALAEEFGIKGPPAVAPVAEAAPVAKPAEVAPAVHPKVAALETQLATLQEKYRAARASYDPAASDMLEDITDVKMDLRDARREAAAEAQREAEHKDYAKTWEAAQAESQARSIEKFGELITAPDANDDEGFLTRCNYEIYLAEQKNDPILTRADWSEKIGQKVFDKFFKGKAANSADSDTDESTSAPPAPKQSVRLPGSPAGTGFAAGGLSREAAEAEFNKLPWDERLKILGQAEDAIKR